MNYFLTRLIYIIITFYPGLLFAQSTFSVINQRKAESVVTQVADHYQPPSMDIGDPEKYYWPKTIARFYKYGVEDSLGNAYIEALSPNSPFHFTLVGMARLYYLFPQAPALIKNRTLILKEVFERDDSNNAWTSEGTENHISMARTSGYLFAQAALEYPDLFPEASRRMQQMKAWMQEWSSLVYQVGSGEWHSSIYEIYNLMGWLNLFDFARDQEVKQMARAVLDYYAAEMSLHYSFLIPGGSEMRGGGVGKAIQNGTTYLNWWWYGPQTAYPAPLQGNQYIQLMHPITSNYLPPEAARVLARKKADTTGWYLGSKPTYLLNQPSFVKQFFYFDNGYTLGSGISEYGGWTGASHQIVNWKLVIQNEEDMPYEVSGNGTFWEQYTGRTRDPWTQYFQHQQVMVQLTRVPAEGEKLYQAVEDTALAWSRRWKSDFLQRFPGETGKQVYHKPESVHIENESFLTFPSETQFTVHETYWLAEIGNKRLLIVPVNGKNPEKELLDDRILLFDRAARDELCGFIVEVLKEEDNFDYYLEVKEAEVHYQSCQGDLIEVDYAVAGGFREALFDWGYGTTERSTRMTSPPFRQPDWPQGAGLGKLPEATVNGKKIELRKAWPVFEGPDLSLKNGVLTLTEGNYLYEVDYSGKFPVFKQELR